MTRRGLFAGAQEEALQIRVCRFVGAANGKRQPAARNLRVAVRSELEPRAKLGELRVSEVHGLLIEESHPFLGQPVFCRQLTGCEPP